MSQNETKKLWDQLRGQKVEASPFLKAQSLAKAQALTTSPTPWGWKLVAQLSWVATAALALILWIDHGTDKHLAATDKAYVLNLQLSDSEAATAKIAEVELPDGLVFHSELHPEIELERSLRVKVSSLGKGKNSLPFIVKAKKAGRYKFAVRLYDEENRLLKEEQFNYKFL